MSRRWYDKSTSETTRNGAEALAFGTTFPPAVG